MLVRRQHSHFHCVLYNTRKNKYPVFIRKTSDQIFCSNKTKIFDNNSNKYSYRAYWSSKQIYDTLFAFLFFRTNKISKEFKNIIWRAKEVKIYRTLQSNQLCNIMQRNNKPFHIPSCSLTFFSSSFFYFSVHLFMTVKTKIFT